MAGHHLASHMGTGFNPGTLKQIAERERTQSDLYALHTSKIAEQLQQSYSQDYHHKKMMEAMYSNSRLPEQFAGKPKTFLEDLRSKTKEWLRDALTFSRS